MDISALLYSLATLILATALGACCVVVSWRWGSASTRPKKQPASEPATPISGRMDRLEADQVELSSNVEKLLVSMKRLTSRAAVQDHRARQSDADSDPDQAAPQDRKAALYRKYGLAGKTAREIAAMAMEKVRNERAN